MRTGQMTNTGSQLGDTVICLEGAAISLVALSTEEAEY